MFFPRADGYGRPPSPQVDRSEIRPHLCTGRAGARVNTCGESTSDAVVELGGERPFGSSPRAVVPKSPSCPSSFRPQHLRVASSCIEKQARITGWLSKDGWCSHVTPGPQIRNGSNTPLTSLAGHKAADGASPSPKSVWREDSQRGA